MIALILSIISAVLYVYTLVCLASVIMTWLPGVKFTKVGKFVSKISDPYMNIFSRKGWFRLGYVDFSPIVSIGLLTLVSTILANIQKTGKIYIGGILSTIIGSIWGIAQSLIGLLFLFIFIRWIALLVSHGVTPYDSIWTKFDQALNGIVYKICGTFYKKPINYQNALLVSWIVVLSIDIIGWIAISVLIMFIEKMPV